MKLKTKRQLIGTAFITPWLIGFLLFFLTPVLQTFIFSLHTVNITATGYSLEPVGFNNFIYALRSDAEFPIALFSSLLHLLSDVPFILAFSFFIAVVINQNFKGSHTVKLIFFLTVILSTGAFQALQMQTSAIQASQLTSVLKENDSISGIMSSIQVEKYMTEIGLPKQWVGYLTAPMMRLFSILSNSGIQIFIFLAALKTIAPSLYESSKIEGATGWESFWMITFPMVSPMIVINVVYTVIDSFFSSSNETLNYVQSVIFKSIKFGYGSALAWIYFLVISIILALVIFVISKKVFYYDK